MTDAAHRADAPRKAPPSVAPGVVLAERFRLEQPLGAGGMAEVWRAFDLTAQRTVALKLLRPQIAGSAEAVQRLKREGEVLSALSHPAIVRVETYGHLEGGVVFLAMELLEGETLGARMRRGVMQPSELAPIVAGTCAALGAAHAKGIVHRDLKPDNIFLVPRSSEAAGAEPQVKLLDFGISKVFGGDRLTYTGEILGTPRYMSPEQLGAEPDVDPRVDIYALGVIAYEAVAGRPPFLASTPTDLIVAILHGKIAPLRSLRPDLAPGIEAAVSRAMARAREARYACAADFADAFLEAAGATARARALPKPQVLRTQALGGAGLVRPSVPSPEALAAAHVIEPSGSAGSDEDMLRPGTFSAFGAVEESAIRSAQTVDPGTLPALAATLLAPAYPQEAPLAAPNAPPITPPITPPIVAAMPAQASESWGESAPAAWRDSLTPPPASPMRGRVLLVLVGLLAGALSAGLAMAALHFWRASAPAPEPMPPAVTAPPRATSVAPIPREVERAEITAPEEPSELAPALPTAPDAPDALPTAPDAPDALPTAPDAPDALPATTHARETDPSSRRERSRRSSDERDDAPASSPASETSTAVIVPRAAEIVPRAEAATVAPVRPADPMAAAASALAEGEPAACVAILDELILRGATPYALKRRADCLLRAGRRADAIRDYQRFCHVAPDHPAVASVREQLAGMGLTCP